MDEQEPTHPVGKLLHYFSWTLGLTPLYAKSIKLRVVKEAISLIANIINTSKLICETDPISPALGKSGSGKI